MQTKAADNQKQLETIRLSKQSLLNIVSVGREIRRWEIRMNATRESDQQLVIGERIEVNDGALFLFGTALLRTS